MPKVTRRYSVDLREPADERWAAMIHAEAARGRRVIRACMDHFQDSVGWMAVKAAKLLLPEIHHRCGNNFGDDLDAWSKGTGIERGDLILANLSYELTQLKVFKSILKSLNPFGCTAAAYNLPKRQGVAHIRNLDWPLPACGPNTTLIDFESDSGPFTAVGWPAFVGILSAVAPGRFSATINMAPQAGVVTAQWPPSFALRHIFERCDNFDEAVSMLRKYKLAASALFMVVGTKPDQAVVIEHSGTSAACRWMKDGVLAVSNHYDTGKMYGFNADDDVSSDDDEYCTDSEARLDHALTVAAKKAPPTASTLRDAYLCNAGTVQQMSFNAKTGACSAVWRNT
ncbi:MAG: C45 family autoproteolytic acyltransferase/hydrolase [Planctomycetota bacterium]